MINSKLMKRI